MIDAPHVIDAPVDVAIDAPATGSGTHYRYILDSLSWPTTNPDAQADGFDLDGNGRIDNQLGSVNAALVSNGGFDVQTPTDQAIARGDVLMLADLQTTDLTTATGAGYTMYIGTNPSPAPCNGSTDTTCRHHLDGTGTFDVAAMPRDPQLIGAVATGTYTGGPGHLSMQLSIAGGAPVTFTLLAAHAELTPTSTAITRGKIGGAIAMSDFHDKIYPALQQTFATAVTRDCTMTNNPPQCGCASNSQGANLISLYDANHDCAITTPEIENNSLTQALFAPDVTVEGQQALSAGFAVTAVKATFTP